MPAPDEFQTARLLARRIGAADFPDLQALYSDPNVMAWLSATGAVSTEAQTRARLEREVNHWREHGFGVWMLRSKADGSFVGRAGWRRMPIQGREEVELTYAIGSAWWGQGLTTEVGRELVALALGPLGFQQPVTFTVPHNRASRRVMEKLGFVYERDIVHADLPHVLYRLPPSATTSSAPRHYLSCAQVRAVDGRALAEYGLSPLVLMENAGRGAAATLLSLGIHGPVVVCCGKGNNGGDGLVIARHLHNAEVDVKVLLLAEPAQLSPDAAANWRSVERAGVPRDVWPAPDEAALTAEFARAEWLVDALFGTGLKGPVRPPLEQVIAAVNASSARTFAVDIPSGLGGDTGEPWGATIRASHTATFVAPKKGFANPAAVTWLGKVHVIDIGVPQRLVEDVMMKTE